MKKILIALSSALASCVVMAAPMVSGIQVNVSQADFIASGWKVASSEFTSQIGTIASAVNGIGNSDRIAVAVLDNSTGIFLTLAETTLGSFQTYTAVNETHDDNGVAWYYNANSIGYTQVGYQISQRAADTKLGNPGNVGLSWHTTMNGTFDPSLSPTEFYGGWGANNGTFFSTWSEGFSRVFLIEDLADATSVPEPGSVALLSLGLIGVAAVSRKKKV